MLSPSRICAFVFALSCAACQSPEETGAGGSWALLGFEKADAVNPVLSPDSSSFTDPVTNKRVFWEQKDVFNPAIVVKDGKVWMLYRAQDTVGLPAGTSRIGIAESGDGLHFTRYRTPVLYPDNDACKVYEWQGGCEDPRIVEDANGTYYMTYTAYDGKLARLLVASSRDLFHWTKHGPVFADAYHGKYLNKWSKSGSIVCRYEKGKAIAEKINGKYWMYFGDVFIYTAVSDDLVHWTPVEMKPGEQPPVPPKNEALNMPALLIAIPTRNGKFDSDLVEPGPPAMVTDKGIVLIYNSRNLRNIGDTSLPDGTYTGGQVLMDKNDPTKILARLDNYFFRPDKPYEITGQVNNVCFLEGLAYFKNSWFIYYGTADSKIAVAERR
ncbi:glycoside hydrolase family 130 protein [Sediminibacterium soli]|uniref:glycoside hydrolase family 130 protein n=1 Tax=Sediminibacterium soli TaxID=2698829 RepID=UPI00137A7E82|nr:glycoside hydrolase family 130 protein [Sediminibacterium soli]NCI48103.1 glycosidase [Sediminibacterium soli]